MLINVHEEMSTYYKFAPFMGYIKYLRERYTLINHGQKISPFYDFTLFRARGTKFTKKNTMKSYFNLFLKLYKYQKEVELPLHWTRKT